jgi:hypothetical protein
MENVNIGIANLIISNKLRESYFNDKLIVESKKLAKDFLDVVKNSPVLQLEFKVFNNIENKYIENEQAATRYIDNNIKLFEIYTIEEIHEEKQKLNNFLTEDVVPVLNEAEHDLDRVSLYGAIDDLIRESLGISDEVDVDKLHEAFATILTHIQKPKKTLTENVDIEEINENVLEIAVNKFNQRYAGLDDNDRNLVNALIKANNNDKQQLLETYKTETLEILNEIEEETNKENIEKAVKKINEMRFDKDTVDDNIIELHELKKELV